MKPEIVVIIVLASFILLYDVIRPLIIASIVGKMIYTKHLVRKNPDDWGRDRCSAPDNYEQMIMWQTGLKWGEENKAYCEPVSIVSDGLKLYGEFYNFFQKRTVIIIPGRTESLQYSYYFARPYHELGFNILVIDKRAHGWSEGKYEDGGEHSYVDIIGWIKLLHDEYGCNDISLHAICIGSSTALFAYVSDECPDYVTHMVADGMFRTFKETFVNHMKVERRPIFPYANFAMMYAKHYAKCDLVRNGPIYQIDKVKKPFLFLYSKTDKFSTPKQAEALFKKCGTDKKELVWFDHGAHSHLLITDPIKYKYALAEFYEKYQ